MRVPIACLAGAIARGARPLLSAALAVTRARRVRGAWAVLALAFVAVAMIPALTGPPQHGRLKVVRADDVTASLNKLRTRWDPGEPKLNDDSDLRIPITFKPARAGRFTGTYRLTWTDRLGTHTSDIPLSGEASR